MEAIIRDGGRQFRVEQGGRIEIDYRSDAEPGSAVEFGDVLYVNGDGGARIGSPVISGARVVGKIIGTVQGPKLTVMKFRRRKNSKCRTGHRQKYTQVEIESIEA